MKLRIIRFNSVNSTNDEAIKLIKINKCYPSIISAKIQKKGRGTMGKKWISLKGNLFISIFFEIDKKKIKVDEFLKININLIKSILDEYSKYKIGIKFPNDLLVKGCKISGILQEIIEHKSKKFLIIGIGVNTFLSPKDKGTKTISLLDCSNRTLTNLILMNKIKIKYEKLISDINKFSSNYIKKKYI